MKEEFFKEILINLSEKDESQLNSPDLLNAVKNKRYAECYVALIQIIEVLQNEYFAQR